jgi:hypothetical protein
VWRGDGVVWRGVIVLFPSVGQSRTFHVSSYPTNLGDTRRRWQVRVARDSGGYFGGPNSPKGAGFLPRARRLRGAAPQ